MTKTTKIIALVAAVLILIGTFFKTSHWPGANVIMAVGLATGIVLFLSLVAAFWKKLTTGFGQFNGIFTSIIIILALFAFTFKLLHWPGAGKLVWIADVGILLASASFLIDGLRDDDKYTSALKIIAGFFILILALVIVLV
jgi:hypothetical protein